MNDNEIRFIKALRAYYESEQKPAKRHARGRRKPKHSRGHTKTSDRRQRRYTAILDDFDILIREGKL